MTVLWAAMAWAAMAAMAGVVVAVLVSSRHQDDDGRGNTRRTATWFFLPFAVFNAAIAATEQGTSRYLMSAAALITLGVFATHRLRLHRYDVAPVDRYTQ